MLIFHSILYRLMIKEKKIFLNQLKIKNNMNKIMLTGIIFSALFLVGTTNPPSIFAEENSSTETTPLNSSIGVEKTTLKMIIPENNKLPWGFVEGKISNPVPDYPVIIQIFDNDDSVRGNNVGAVLFAQTNVKTDGSYEYKFRVLDTKDGHQTHIFQGEYTVKIFKVVYLKSNLKSV